MSTTLRAVLSRASQQLAQRDIASAALDARLLLQHVMQVTHEWLVQHDNGQMSAEHGARFEALLARRAQHEPMAHLLGTRAFWKDSFIVSPDTLIPRPDSETVIEALLKFRPDTNAPLNILELGLGTGCLLFSALREYPNARGVGVDISEAALQIAKQNCQALSLTQRVNFFHGSWCEALPEALRFDVVISNPP
ncbi:MAG: HemK/PrmC family methyltransferase, partial [Alphaproteobacteria bacterium]|nr:HemK/PrmC family methyltransferase [Alphaproteobacteria bacterium]